MDPLLVEWLNLVVRWVHVLAAILWIGDSFLFMWMDSSLTRPARPREGDVAGELWMVHSGGFYEVVKRRTLAPHELPSPLHWFKWQAYSTWFSGFLLMAIVYWMGSGAALVEPGPGALHRHAAILLSGVLLLAAWWIYDALWMSPLGRREVAAAAVSLALLAASAFGVTRVFSGRAAFLQLGAMLGTVMASNVMMRIIPAQNRMLAATRAGQPMDAALGARAKQRSVHNHYLTLPVLFTMLSNHFPSTYGHPAGWIVLLLLIALGMAAKHVMNARGASDRRVLLAGAAAVIGLIVIYARPMAPLGEANALEAASGPAVPFETAHAIIERRCLSCHSAAPANPSFPEAPGGVAFDRPEQIQGHADRIAVRAVRTRTMPLGNLTGMTDGERRQLGAWIAQGARVDAPR